MSANDIIDPKNRPLASKPVLSPTGGLIVDGGVTLPHLQTMRRKSSLSNQLLFVYGAGLAIGLQLGLLTLYLRHSVSGAIWTVGATLFYATLTIALWRWVLPRFSTYPLPRRIAAQTLVTI